MILIDHFDCYINEFILDYYSDFCTFQGMYKSIQNNSKELLLYFIDKESRQIDHLLQFMYFDGAQLAAAYNNTELFLW